MQAAETLTTSTTRQVYHRIARKLGVRPLKSDLDLLRLVEKRLSVDSLESLASLHLAAGGRLALTGSSGAGKSPSRAASTALR